MIKNVAYLNILILIMSCSIQHRKYMNGYYIDWHLKSNQITQSKIVSKKAKKEQSADNLFEKYDRKPSTDMVLAQAGKNKITFKKNFRADFKKLNEDTCDVLLFKDGTRLNVIVKEINTNSVKYLRCDILNGPLFASKLSEVSQINYANGKQEVISAKSPISSQLDENNVPDYHPLTLPAFASGIVSLISGFIIGVFFVGMGNVTLLIVLPFLFGLFAMIGGVIAYKATKKSPERYGGKSKAIWAYFLGLIAVIAFSLIYSAVLFLFV